MKISKALVGIAFAALLTLAVSLYMISEEKINLSYHGFALDPEFNVYVGKDSYIEVYSPDGELLRTMRPYTSRGYRFKIDNDVMTISSGGYLYRTDLNGRLLGKKEIRYQFEDEVTSHIRIYTYEDGTDYAMMDRFLRVFICRVDGIEKETVYEMPTIDYVIRLLDCFAILVLAAVLPAIIVQAHKKS